MIPFIICASISATLLLGAGGSYLQGRMARWSSDRDAAYKRAITLLMIGGGLIIGSGAVALIEAAS